MRERRPEINFACRTCGNGLLLPLDADAPGVECSICHEGNQLASVGYTSGPIDRCAACGSESLFVQRQTRATFHMLIPSGSNCAKTPIVRCDNV